MAKTDFRELGVTGLSRDGGIVRDEYLRELQGDRWLAVVRAVDASRPGLTLEESRLWVERRFPSLVGHAKQCSIEIAVRASRGETGPAPTWGEQAIEEHRRAADAQRQPSVPPDPRATLHAGDPASVLPDAAPVPPKHGGSDL